MNSTLDKQTVSKIASGLASIDEMQQLPADDVIEIKKSKILQRRVHSGEIRKVDQDSRTIEWVVSDETSDRMGDVIRVAGWDLRNYKKNPVVLWSHDQGMDHSIPAIGRALRTWKGEKKGGGKALIQEIEFAPADAHPFAETVYQLASKGFLRATSVGFLPIKAYSPKDSEEREKLGLGEWGVVFEKSELLENSVVNVPANPSALQNAMSDMVQRGVISDAAARAFVAEAIGQEPSDWFGKAKSLVVDLEGLGEKVRAIFDESTADEAPSGEEAEVAEQEAAGDGDEEEGDSTLDSGSGVLAPADGGEDAPEPAASASTLAFQHPFKIKWVSDPAPDYSLLVGALARLIEQETERTAATRLLVDTVTDLARKVVSMADSRPAPIEEPMGKESDGRRTDGDEPDLSAARRAAEELLRNLRG